MLTIYCEITLSQEVEGAIDIKEDPAIHLVSFNVRFLKVI